MQIIDLQKERYDGGIVWLLGNVLFFLIAVVKNYCKLNGLKNINVTSYRPVHRSLMQISLIKIKVLLRLHSILEAGGQNPLVFCNVQRLLAFLDSWPLPSTFKANNIRPKFSHVIFFLILPSDYSFYFEDLCAYIQFTSIIQNNFSILRSADQQT